MSPGSPTQVRQYVKGGVCGPETILMFSVFVYTFQNGKKLSPLRLRKPKKWPVPVKGNHPSIQPSYVYWVRQWAGICG
jgi:hypothetical protein